MQYRRRQVLKAVAGAAALSVAGRAPGARRAQYRGPNVIIVRFGGGVRREETIIDSHTHAPYLLHNMAPRGVLFNNMVLDDEPHVVSSHGQGTLYLMTGRYDALVNQSDQMLGERFEPPAPTIFEYFRKQFDVSAHEALIVNGEDRESEEFYTFSNHHQFGINFRSEVLSMFRFKTFALRQQLAANGFIKEQERANAELELARRLSVDSRRSDATGQSSQMQNFWQQWAHNFGHQGFKNARGDRLITQLALRAMDTLQPRLMMLNYQDPDYVHWGYPSHYTRGIAVIDRALEQLENAVAASPVYRGNTVFVIVPDCGRDNNRFSKIPFQHHFNSASAHEIWALVLGSGIPAGKVVSRKVSQISVASTVAGIMGFDASESDAPALRECFS